jgi:hypothetical protein
MPEPKQILIPPIAEYTVSVRSDATGHMQFSISQAVDQITFIAHLNSIINTQLESLIQARSHFLENLKTQPHPFTNNGSALCKICGQHEKAPVHKAAA